MRATRVVALIMGCLLVIPSIALLFGGSALGLAYAFGRGDDGYFDVNVERLTTDTVAITAENVTFAADPGSPDVLLDALDADVRIRATNADAGRDVFVGIARQADVDAYLEGIAHDEVIDLDDDLVAEYRSRSGADAIDPPGDQDFWAESTAGPGTRELEWEAAAGRWSVVVMNADGDPGVSVDVNVGTRAGFLAPLALIMIAIGALLMAFSVALIVAGARDAQRRTEPDQVPPAAPPVAVAESVGTPAHPLTLSAHLDPELSRWQWLVKWFLAIPHFIVLVFLWTAFVVLTFVAAVAIVVTGRYPPGIFDFNVGVLRWSWRVGYYATTGGIGTDRYPPFSLRHEPGDPATLDIVYPERLSRGLVFVKWLLALPHVVIVAVLVGTSVRWLATDGDRVAFDPTGGGGLLGILVLVAGVVLLITGRYPTALFDLIVGLNRWIYRTVAYVALMTDDYPPFRLDQGAEEPSPTPDHPPSTPDGPPHVATLSSGSVFDPPPPTAPGARHEVSA